MISFAYLWMVSPNGIFDLLDSNCVSYINRSCELWAQCHSNTVLFVSFSFKYFFTMYIIGFILSFATLLYSSTGTSKWFFDSNFQTPEPPLLVAEYQANFVQHKWDATGISHIASGIIYANLEVGRLRMDLTYDGTIASSMFDYSIPNPDGTVPNFMLVQGWRKVWSEIYLFSLKNFTGTHWLQRPLRLECVPTTM